MLAALGALPSAAPFGEDGKQLFRILAAGFSVKTDLGPIWDRFGGGERSRFESGILSKICKSNEDMSKMRNRQPNAFARKSREK